jgi:hypothetical protein
MRVNTRNAPNLEPTLEELDDEWRQDYIVFRRRAR